MDKLTEEQQDKFVSDLLSTWENSEDPIGKKHFVVDKAWRVGLFEQSLQDLWAADYGIDALYDAAKGKFNFDGASPTES